MITFTVLAVAVSSFAMLQSLIVPVMAQLQQDLDTDQATITWVLTAYLLSASVCTPLAGRMGDVVGKVRVLAAALISLALGSVVAAAVQDVRWLIAARVLQGVGGAVVPLAYGIVRDQFEERIGQAAAAISSLNAAGFGLGILAAGPVYDLVGYRGLFLLPLVPTVPAALAAMLLVRDSGQRATGRPPFLPAMLLSAALVGTLLAVSMGPTWGVRAPQTLISATIGLVGTVAWIAADSRVRVPLVDLRLMRLRAQWTCNVVVAFLGFSTFAAFGFLPQLLQTPKESGYGLGADLVTSGLLLLPWALATFAVGFGTAALVRTTSPRAVMCVGSLVTGIAFAGLAVRHDTAWQIAGWTTVQGLGAGLVTGSMAVVVVSSVPLHQTGLAGGMNANIRTIGGALGSAVMGAIVTAHHGAGGLPAERGYVLGFAVLAASMACAAVVAGWVPVVPLRGGRGGLVGAVDAELGLVAAAPVTPVRPDRARGRRSGPRSRRR